jgi:hypothetical protein
MAKLHETKEYLGTWLTNFQKAAKIAPTIQEAYDQVDWACNAFDSYSKAGEGPKIEDIDKWSEEAYEGIKTNLPQMPIYDANTAIKISAMTTSANTAMTEHMYKVSQLESQVANQWAMEQIVSYKTLQERQERPTRVRTLLASRWRGVVGRYDAAVTAYRQYVANPGTDRDAYHAGWSRRGVV